MASRVMTPNIATIRNAIRHDMVLVINVPAGTPTSVATVIPAIIMATALTSLPGAASLRATIAPTPKYAPWGSPEIRRAAIKVQNPGAMHANRFPDAIIPANRSIRRLSGSLRANSSAGAPQQTPKA